MKNFEDFLIKTSEINGIVDFLNWMNYENFQPSGEDNATWVHVGSDNAEEYSPLELLTKYELLCMDEIVKMHNNKDNVNEQK